ncbi:hypothetical protein BABINDRAFT_35362 [Babjeviella inositovora NRRL Y-12698]|uniref:RING-type domain-containing protein n=1 Tax=Babjeviella inositovora NRRL Y-12698 TaxID=984486 RepID=A0A1E3QRH2_9ASCO|nr:uncharacterized protein BABINDRAFT_35362 [Babjeviella inositovora NRRL Y-12698]ODQ80306.1 hypothetical protein BABINDRAFT_35362 [Babjeviella inositovora NRRL Y-12698]
MAHGHNPQTRVNQLDSVILDNELFDLVHEQLVSVFQHWQPQWKTSYGKEIRLGLRLLLFKNTVWDNSQLYGMKVQNLRMSSSSALRTRKLALLVLILGEYGWNVFQSYLFALDLELPTETRKTKWTVLKRNVVRLLLRHRDRILASSKLYSILSMLNFVAFLVNGEYISLKYRLLGLKIYKPVHQDLLKFQGSNVSFEFQNRQLVWNTLTEFLIFTLPMLQLHKLKTSLLFLSLTPKASAAPLLAHLPEKRCVICYHTYQTRRLQMNASQEDDAGWFLVTNPYTTNCGHTYCYLCVLTKLELSPAGKEVLSEVDERELWDCLRCGAKVKYATPFEDVDLSCCVAEEPNEESAASEHGSSEESSEHEFSEHSSYEEISSESEPEEESDIEAETGGFFVE